MISLTKFLQQIFKKAVINTVKPSQPLLGANNLILYDKCGICELSMFH